MTVAATTAPAPSSSRRRVWLGTAAVVLVALLFNVAEHRLGLPVWVGPTMALGLVGFARLLGLSWAQLGMGRAQLLSGLRWGGGAILVVAAIYGVGLLLPFTRTAFLDVRYHLSISSALFTALVAIPISTVLVEEVLFRSVLWGFLARHAAAWRVLLVSSVLFGLWHVLPSIGLASANQAIGDVASAAGGAAVALVVGGTVLFTAAGGVVAGELRRRSGSVLASAGMHWATNAMGVLFGLLAWQLVT